MLVTSHWPGFVQLLAAHGRLWSPITQLETCWFYTIGILQTGEIIQAEKFYQFLSRNIVSAYCLIGHTFPRSVSTFEVSIPTPNCFGVDFIKATRRNSLILKDPLFMIRVMDSPRPVARDHPQSPASLWDPHRIIVTQRPRDSDRDIIVTCHVRFA